MHWLPSARSLKLSPNISPPTHLPACLFLAQSDNEDNALVALRILFDLHKNYRPKLEAEVQPFLDFVIRVSVCVQVRCVALVRVTWLH